MLLSALLLITLRWTTDELLEIVKGPDFPTAGVIYGRSGIRQAASTGRGKITVPSEPKYHLEEVSAEKDAIIVTELPYMVNKANLDHQDSRSYQREKN